MGVNNRQRRAAKKKRRAGPAGPRAERFIAEVTPEQARLFLLSAVDEVADDPAAAAHLAQALLRPDAPVPPSVIREALAALLAELTANLVAHGWRPSDLVQTVSRRPGPAAVAVVVGLVSAETARHPSGRVSDAWREDLVAAGVGASVELHGPGDVRAALELAAALSRLPALAVLTPPPGATSRPSGRGAGGDPRLLAKVRALLAKAESTEFDEEAEALSTKAQELISRHALDRLLVESPDAAAAAQPGATRLWIDAPYVFAKSTLVSAVAHANRCRSILTERLGCCTLIGDEGDLAAVELLVTSLLLQAGTAMRRHGRQTDARGTSRTTSFRQSFLLSYASRIGERLQAATDEAVQVTGRSGELVPVLRRQAERLEATTSALFPELVSREVHISNAQGWVAGRAAADQAVLDTDLAIARAAG